MAKNSLLSKLIIALVVILIILIIWQFAHVPETEETPIEQVEEVNWEEVDKIEVISSGASIWLTKSSESFVEEDSSHRLNVEQFNQIISTIKDFKKADYEPVDFRKWSKDFSISEAVILKFYKNTEQVLDLYLYPNDTISYFRYLNDSSIYRANKINLNNRSWLDSVMLK